MPLECHTLCYNSSMCDYRHYHFMWENVLSFEAYQISLHTTYYHRSTYIYQCWCNVRFRAESNLITYLGQSACDKDNDDLSTLTFWTMQFVNYIDKIESIQSKASQMTVSRGGGGGNESTFSKISTYVRCWWYVDFWFDILKINICFTTTHIYKHNIYLYLMQVERNVIDIM